MFCRLIALAGLGALLAGPAVAADLPTGSLVIAGGQFRSDNPGWARLVALAGGKGAPFLVFPTASDTPQESGRRAAAELERLGARAVVLPLAAHGFPSVPATIAHDPAWVERARTARGFFFVGGDQGRITASLVEPDGKPTPLLASVWEAYRSGAVIGGSSAGAAIMSATMFEDPPSPLDLLKLGAAPGRTLGSGLGFIGPDWFVDQHFLVRGRFARALVGMHLAGYRRGLGIDEDTALVVTGGRHAEVVGRSGVVLLDLGEADWRQEHPVSLTGARLGYLASGDRIDLVTSEVTPAPIRAGETAIRPASPGFQPGIEGGDSAWTADMLGPGQLTRALTHALDGPADSVTDLAIGPPGIGPDPSLGFEFRFSRDGRTHGWSSTAGEAESYTVLEVRLDITPIRLAEPLYRPATPR